MKIAVEARFPGGAPPSSFRLERAVGTIWFDSSDGLVVKCEAYVDTADAAADPEAEPRVKRWIKRSLSSLYELEPGEGKEVRVAAGLFFGVLDMVEKRQYAKASKTVDAAVDGEDLHRKYRREFITDLKALIPEVRMSQQAGAAMRDRKTRSFRNLPWRRLDRPPAMLMHDAPRREGKRRSLPWKGKAAPGWLREHFQSGRVNLIYFVTGHFESSRSAARLANGFRNKASVTGVLLEADQRKMWEFMMSLGGRLNHQIKLDPEMKSLSEGKLPGVPAFFVVDSGGTVRYAEVGCFGETTKSELNAALSKHH